MTNKKSKEQIRVNKPKIRLGYLGKSLLVRGENKRKFEELKRKILREIDPKTEIEIVLCLKFIIATWRHERIIEIEKNMFSGQNVPDIPERDGFDMDFDLGDVKPRSTRRIRNIKKLKLDQPEQWELLKYEVALQKNMLKIYECIRKEQNVRMAKTSKDIVRGTVG